MKIYLTRLALACGVSNIRKNDWRVAGGTPSDEYYLFNIAFGVCRVAYCLCFIDGDGAKLKSQKQESAITPSNTNNTINNGDVGGEGAND